MYQSNCTGGNILKNGIFILEISIFIFLHIKSLNILYFNNPKYERIFYFVYIFMRCVLFFAFYFLLSFFISLSFPDLSPLCLLLVPLCVHKNLHLFF